MTIYRGDTLPPGKYWIDLHGPLTEGAIDTIPIFNEWSKVNTVAVLSTEYTPAESDTNVLSRALITSIPIIGTITGPFMPQGSNQVPAFLFTTFEVHEETPWDKRMGYPNIIEPGQNVVSFDDIVSRPEREDYSVIADLLYGDPYQSSDKTRASVESWHTYLKYGTIAAMLVPAAWLTSNLVGGYRAYLTEKKERREFERDFSNKESETM